MVPEVLGVIGLGGVGGAVAAQAVRSGVPTVLGFDASTKDGVAAVRAGAVTELTHDPEAVIRRAEFVVLGGTARAAVRVMDAHGALMEGCGTLCTDVAGIKRPVTAAAARCGLASWFAGSHTVVDARSSRFGGVGPDTLEGALVYVTPLEGGERAAAEVGDFWARVVGAHPVMLTAERHDELVAWTDDLPSAAAAVVAVTLARSAPSGVTHRPDAIEMTRLASRDPEASTRALMNNRDNVLAALDALQASAADLRAALEAGDVRAVREWIGEANQWRSRYDP